MNRLTGHNQLFFLVSSKALGNKLNELGERVERLAVDGSTLTLIGQTKSVTLDVTVRTFAPALNQVDRRWDWVKDLMNKIEDQPVYFQCYEHIVNIIFQY